MKVKVRIALAIDSEGSWCAYGSNPDGKKSLVHNDKAMFDCVLDGVKEGERRYILEAEVEQSDENWPVVPAIATEVAQ